MTTTAKLKALTVREELAKLEPEAKVQRINELTRGKIRVTYQPDEIFEGENASRGHLYLIEADKSTGCKLPPETYLDNRYRDGDILSNIFGELEDILCLYHDLYFDVDKLLQPEDYYDENGKPKHKEF
ncbi:MAG: hypothetical protein GXP26_05035 [Planctomycetes bacterium]|nr:hypothetical protein [Planctomycetota bacterium]